MKMKTGIVFDIQRYSVHDGPGIRTVVFLKGCPLRCRWCSNPESQQAESELAINGSLCLCCGQCITACPQKALSAGAHQPELDKSLCNGCGLCQQVCAGKALKLFGEEKTVEEVLEVVNKDRPFYRRSGGGMTLSGGEPAMQPQFAAELLREAGRTGLNTNVETCGYAPWDSLWSLLRESDLVYYDLKHVNDKKHKEHTGTSNKIILENLLRLSEKKRPLVVRIPLIPGFNNDDVSIGQIASFIKELAHVDRLGLLPYHAYGKGKYAMLGREYLLPDVKPPSEEEVARAKKQLEDAGFRVEVGS
jgi:pyruvate formate lyase activating enzyme